MMMKRKPGGYFTVEAAMVLPVVLMTVVVMIYMLFYQYNRCLMEQDVGALALRGAAMQADNETRIQKLRGEANMLDGEEYIAWDSGVIGLTLEKGMIRVEQTGEVRFPFRGVMDDSKRVWTTTAVFENHIISPSSVVRIYRKIKGGQ